MVWNFESSTMTTDLSICSPFSHYNIAGGRHSRTEPCRIPRLFRCHGNVWISAEYRNARLCGAQVKSKQRPSSARIRKARSPEKLETSGGEISVSDVFSSLESSHARREETKLRISALAERTSLRDSSLGLPGSMRFPSRNMESVSIVRNERICDTGEQANCETAKVESMENNPWPETALPS